MKVCSVTRKCTVMLYTGNYEEKMVEVKKLNCFSKVVNDSRLVHLNVKLLSLICIRAYDDKMFMFFSNDSIQQLSQ